MGPMIVNPYPGANFVSMNIALTLSLTPLQKQRGFFLKFFFRLLENHYFQGPLSARSGHQRLETTKKVSTAWYSSFRSKSYACMIGVWSDGPKKRE